jgi:hypothetical protein
MFVLYFLLVIFGIFMLEKPTLIWSITEMWKSNNATEPSYFYSESIRFCGVMCTLAGIGGIIVLLL